MGANASTDDGGTTGLPPVHEAPNTPAEAEGGPLVLSVGQSDSSYMEVASGAYASVHRVPGDFTYVLSVRDSVNNCIHTTDIETDMSLVFNQNTVSWYHYGGGNLYHLQATFESADALYNLRVAMVKALAEFARKDDFTKAYSKPEDQQWLYDAYGGDVDMPDPDTVDEALSEDDNDFEDAYDDQAGREAAGGWDADDAQEHNKLLAVGKLSDRSYVVRGSQIGVFKQNEYDGIEYCTTINRVKGLDGMQDAFSPCKVMLSESDRAMLLLRSGQEHLSKVYKMDLERGEVIEEYVAQKNEVDMKVRDLNPVQKYADMTDEQLVLGLNKKQAFMIDPRMPTGNNFINDAINVKSYSTNNGFTCSAVAGDGSIAIGSDDGKIRLYKNTGLKTAKTELPGLGDPITAIDVTNDGRWVLATCKRYLMLIPTTHPDDPDTTGFQKPFAKESKPRPIRLTLTPTDVVRVGKLEFTPAKFDTGRFSERLILTSTGNFIVTWNFRSVVRSGGAVSSYTLKGLAEDVVGDSFRYDRSHSVVVTGPDSVVVANRQKGDE